MPSVSAPECIPKGDSKQSLGETLARSAWGAEATGEGHVSRGPGSSTSLWTWSP